MSDQPNTLPQGVTFGDPVAQDAPAPPALPQGVTFGPAVTQDTPAASLNQQADPLARATPEERSFLQTNPNYTYVQRDANFPNRQAGIYHKDEAGAPSFADPQMEHHPVDLHFAQLRAQYGIQSAINVATLPFGPGEEIVSGLIASLRGMPVAERLLQASNLLKLAEKHP